jgi:hypothetical protein
MKRALRRPDIDALFRAGTPIDKALRAAVRAAIEAHRRAGHPIVVSRRGRVVTIPARRIR